MCGRFDFHTLQILPERYSVRIPKDSSDSYNIAPSQQAVIVTAQDAEVKPFGIVPKWDETKHLINARAETIEEKPTFKKLFSTKRCLVPANGFYEWQRTDGKQPFYCDVPDEEVFSLAGIYDENGFAIITTTANAAMKPIHDRMPVILERKDEGFWLEEHTLDSLLGLLHPYSAAMNCYPVSKKVNSPRNNFEALLEPVYRNRT